MYFLYAFFVHFICYIVYHMCFWNPFAGAFTVFCPSQPHFTNIFIKAKTLKISSIALLYVPCSRYPSQRRRAECHVLFCFFLKREFYFKQRELQSAIVITVKRPKGQRYDKFVKDLRAWTSKEPFNSDVYVNATRLFEVSIYFSNTVYLNFLTVRGTSRQFCFGVKDDCFIGNTVCLEYLDLSDV